MKKIIILMLLLCLVPLVSADVNVTLTVAWNLFSFPLYTGIVCIENTNLFGVFDTIIMEYSHDEHSGNPPSGNTLFLQNQGGNIYCANLPNYWNSTSPTDTLDNVKITIKNKGDMIFQDDVWSTDVPFAINDSNHLFYLMQVICVDKDNDGYYSSSATCPMGNDCNDSNPGIYPGAIEICNNVDDDCDDEIDEDYVATPTTCGIGECASTGVLQCIDGEEINNCTPGKPTDEICDGKDNDCDGVIDDEGAEDCINYYFDNDNDGYGIGDPKCLCNAGYYNASVNGDCNDTNPLIKPGATDIPKNNVDENCDGEDAPFISGNKSDIKADGLKNELIVKIDDSENLTKNFTGIQNISIMDGNNTIIEFSHNFSLSTLNLNFSINKTNQSNKGGIVIGNLELQENERKTVYFDHLNSSLNTICIHDAPILSINEISLGCNGTNEVSLYCTAGGNSVTFNGSTYTCYDLGSQYKVDGLKHSGIIEYSYTSPPSDGGTGGGGGGGGGRIERTCIESWTCTDWSPEICPVTRKQTRTCTDNNNCGTKINKPNEIRTCFYYVPPKEKEKEVVEVVAEEAPPVIATPPEPTPQTPTPRAKITGAAIIRAYQQEPLTMIILTLFILLIIGLFTYSHTKNLTYWPFHFKFKNRWLVILVIAIFILFISLFIHFVLLTSFKGV